jgi:hypothetical protein
MGEAPERRDEALLGSRPASAILPACPPRGKLCCACRTLPTLVAIAPPLSVPLKCDLVTSQPMRTDLQWHVGSSGPASLIKSTDRKPKER